MEKKKSIFIIIFVLILFLILLSGCIVPEYPVSTLQARVDFELEIIHFIGGIAYPFCQASSAMFVYDTEPHENWEDYQYSVGAIISEKYRFDASIFDDQVEHFVTYYVRAVAYCYDFKGPLKNYEEGYYAGNDLTFAVNY